MSLVHRALERLPERQTQDSARFNPLKNTAARQGSKSGLWRTLLLIVLVAVLVVQIAFLALSGTDKTSASSASNLNAPPGANLVVVSPQAVPLPTQPAPLQVVVVAPEAKKAAQTQTPTTEAAQQPMTATAVNVIDNNLNTQTQTAAAPPVTLSVAKPLETVPEPPMAQAVETPAKPAIEPVAMASTLALAEQPVEVQPAAEPSSPHDSVTQTHATESVATDAPNQPPTSPKAISAQTPGPDTITPAQPVTTAATRTVSAKPKPVEVQKIMMQAADAMEQGNRANAEALLLEALALAPDNLDMTLAFARFWIKVGEFDVADDSLQAVTAPEAVALRGLIREFRGQDADAMALYGQLAADQHLPSSYQLRYAVLLENAGNHSLAMQWYRYYLTQPGEAAAARQFAAQRIQALNQR